MGYDNNRISPFDNFYSDGCGCKNEEKYYVNGTYIDLCGLPVEEYMKNHCCGGGGNNDNDVVKPINEIYVKSFKNENGEILYQAFSKFAVTSNIKISASSTNNILTVLDLYIGDTQTEPENGDTEDFLSVSISVQEDENYQYIIMTESSKVISDVYLTTMLLSESGSFSENFQKITMENGTTTDIIFTIPSTDVDCNDMEEEELETFCEINQHCFVLCLPKSIYDKNAYSISNSIGEIITNKFVYDKTFNINNVEYIYLKESATTDMSPYVPIYKEDLVYEYKLTLNK